MKNNSFKGLAISGLSVFVFSYASGASLKEVLPFGLNRDDGSVAAKVAFFVGTAPQFALSVKRSGVEREMVEYEGPQDGGAPILLVSKDRKCRMGTIEIKDNKPASWRLGEAQPWTDFPLSQLQAVGCHLEGEYVFIDGKAGSSAVLGDEVREFKRSYTGFTYYSYGKGNEFKKDNLVSLTGSTVYKDHNNFYDKNKDNGSLSVSIPHDEYLHTSGLKLDLSFKYEASKVLRATNIKTFSYSAKWNYSDGKAGADFLKHISPLIGVGKKKEKIANGKYDLNITVTKPLVVQPPGTPGLINGVSAGTVTVALPSHNITANIIYHQGYADVTYSSPTGGTKKVRVGGGSN